MTDTDTRRVRAEDREHVGRIAAVEQRVHVPAHEAAVLQACRRLVGVGRRRCVDRRQVEHDAQLRLAALGSQRLQRQAVAEQQVVRHLHGRAAVLEAGREQARFMPQRGHHPGFVVGHPLLHPIAQRGIGGLRIFGEPVGAGCQGLSTR